MDVTESVCAHCGGRRGLRLMSYACIRDRRFPWSGGDLGLRRRMEERAVMCSDCYGLLFDFFHPEFALGRIDVPADSREEQG